MFNLKLKKGENSISDGTLQTNIKTAAIQKRKNGGLTICFDMKHQNHIEIFKILKRRSDIYILPLLEPVMTSD
jgi:hypothetical protein